MHSLTALPAALPGDGNTFELRDVDVCIPSFALPSPTSNGGPSNTSKEKNASSTFDEDAEPLDHHSGSGTTLVRALSLALRPGMHLMITGSNGVGKTAVARVLAGLWAPNSAGARVTRPTSDVDATNGRTRPGVFVVPQRAYMVTGSLLEQVIYPQTPGEFYALYDGNAEEGLKELQAILEAAHLGYLVEREGGWGTVKEWRDVLSGGEKQRVRCLTCCAFCLIATLAPDGTFARVLPPAQICHFGWCVRLTASCLLTRSILDRMYECCIERRRRPDVRTRQVARCFAHHHLA